jgi:hypothetical protein
MKNSDYRESLFESIDKFAVELDVELPTAFNQSGRKTKENSNKRYRAEDFENVEHQRCNGQYDEILDLIISKMSERFKTDDYKPLITIQKLLLSENDFLFKEQNKELYNLFWDLSIYRTEIDVEKLEEELRLFGDLKIKNKLLSIKNIHHFFRQNVTYIDYFPQICCSLSIFLTVHVSSAEAERSFSVLKRLKTWFRSTMVQTRTSALAIISMNSERLQELNIDSLIEKFSSTKNRRTIFY